MAELYFKVNADYDKVIKLREEISRLESQLKSFGKNTPEAQIKEMEDKLFSAKEEFTRIGTEAARAGAMINSEFKKKIHDALKEVNKLSEDMILQKGRIQQLKNELSGLKEKYRDAVKAGGDTTALEAQIKSANSKFSEQKDIMFGLSQQKAIASLKVKKLKDDYALLNDETKNANRNLLDLSGGMKKYIAAFVGVDVAKEFVSQLIRIRGQFQEMETSIGTLVGEDMKNKLLPQIKELAKVSPLTMTDIVGAEKMMLGFNIEADKTIRYLQALSDVSMGNSQKFNSLTLAFSQMSAAGKLMGQDLNQMINAGFNPLQQISQTTGKSIATLKEEMSKGAVSAQMVQQAFIDATSAGGKFYNMSENASKTIPGQISMLEDAMDAAFNEMGQSNEGVIIGAIEMTTSLIQNYETVGRVLLGLVATYGAYKAAVLVATAIDAVRILGMKDATAYTLLNVKATKAATVAQATWNAVANMNPYVLLATAVIGLGAAIWAYVSSVDEAKEAEEKYQQQKNKLIEAEEKEKEAIQNLISVASDEATSTNLREKALWELEQKYPDIFAKYDTEYEKLSNIKKIKEEIAELDSKKTISNVDNELAFVEKRILELEKKNLDESYETVRGERRGGLNLDDVNELQNLYKKRSELSDKKRKESHDNYFTNLTGISNDELEEEIKKRKDLLATIQLQEAKRGIKGKTYGEIKSGWVFNMGVFTKNEIQAQLQKLESEQNRRSAKTQSSRDWQKEAKEAYLKAKKEYEDFLKSASNKLSKEDYEKEVKRLKTEYEKAEKAYKTAGGNANADNKTQSEKVKAEQKSAANLLKIQEQNAKDVLNFMEDSREKKLQSIKNDYEKRKNEIKKQEKELTELNKKQGIIGLTSEQQIEIDKANKLNSRKQEKATADLYKADIQSMRSYLKEYGTFQQQKLAITEEYAEKIRLAQNEGDRLTAQKQRDKALQDVEINAIKQAIDWGSVFGDFGMMFKEQLQPTINKLQAITDSEQFKSHTLEEQRLVYGLIEKLQQSSTVWNGDIFSQLVEDLETYQTAMRNYNDALDRENSAILKLEIAKADLENAKASGDEDAVERAESRINLFTHELSTARDDISKFGTEIEDTQGDLKSTATSLTTQFQQLESGLAGLTSGNLKGIGQGLMQLDKLFGNGEITKDVGAVLGKGIESLFGKNSTAMESLTKALGSTGTAGEIVSAALGILDILKDGVDKFVVNLVDTVLGAVEGLLASALSFETYKNIGSSLIKGIGGILDTVSFGLFDSSNAKYVAEVTERLTDRNEILAQSIDALKDEMELARGMQTVEAAEEAKKAQQELIENQGGILATNMGYHSAHHSNNYYITQAMTASDWARISERVGKDVSSVEDLWNLSPEDLQKVSQMPDIWEKIVNSGKYDMSQYVNDYLALAGSIEEIDERLKETLTQVSFDSMYDNFIDTLMDMESSSEDFTDNISKYFMKAMLSNRIGEKYSEDLREWYDNYAKAMEDGLDASEIASLRADYDAIVSGAIDERDRLAELTGYNSASSDEQEASSKGLASLSQETGEELNGRFTALQLAGEAVKEQNIKQAESLDLLTMKMDAQLTYSKDLALSADGILQKIAESHIELQEINGNTLETVKQLKEIKSEIKEVKKNTSRL